MSKVEGNEYPSPGLIRSVSANFSGEKTVVIMVGLPYMGKSFVARKLYRFFSWLGFNAKIFNVADRIQNEIDSSWTNDHELRKKYSCKVLYELTNYLKNEGGNLGIYDATNCSKDRRKLVIEILKSSLKNEEYHVVWVESSCGDERLGQIRQKKFRKRGQSAEEIAMEKEKMKYYESKYEPFDEDSELYIKIYEFQKLVSNKIEGYIPAKMLYFLSNVKIEPKPLFFTRHGESEYNVLDKVGGDSPLSAYGRKYAGELYGFMKTQPEFDEVKTKFCGQTL
ncbi:hypothetical protein MHBO_002029 [Bonamia ostreae]|uniref:6-phosphofructo-2-kinase domain-containing protein n=1 Tax=Bonamia ostreae TaxID=126728 RepID=A0ABV2AKY1_9EUKA